MTDLDNDQPQPDDENTSEEPEIDQDEVIFIPPQMINESVAKPEPRTELPDPENED